jgi:hypothetical protein
MLAAIGRAGKPTGENLRLDEHAVVCSEYEHPHGHGCGPSHGSRQRAGVALVGGKHDGRMGN